MVARDNLDCAREWFHFECVALTRKHVETGTVVICVRLIIKSFMYFEKYQ